MLLVLKRINKMNKWILIPLTVIAIPIVVAWMWIRHPVQCAKEAYRSWQLVFRGKDIR